MKQLIFGNFILLLLLTLNTSSHAATKTYQACDKIIAKITRIEQKMRNGYTAEQGERLKQRLRKLKDKRNKCERNSEKAKTKKNSTQKQRLSKPTKQTNSKSSVWQFSNGSKARIEHWQQQQTIENKKIKKLNQKYKDVIKDSNSLSSVDND